MNDVIVQFAVLWGYQMGSVAFGYEEAVSEKMKSYDSEELLKLFSEWAKEYLSSGSDDTVEFFEMKLGELIPEFNYV